MKKHVLEQQIRTAVEHAAPDQLDSILSSCDEWNNAPDAPRTQGQKKGVIDMAEKNHSKSKRRSAFAAVAAVAAVLVLCIGGAHLLRTPDAPAVGDSIVMLDVNPSLSLVVDSGEIVQSVEALNDDAREVLGNMDLRSTSLEVAVNAIIGSMLQKGYLGDLQNTILVSVENKDAAYGEALQKKISQIINSTLRTDSMEAAILSQTVNAGDASLEEQAKKYNISLGKAALIQEVIAQVPAMTFEDLAPMTINEIALIVSSKNVDTGSITQDGVASSKAYISQADALDIAYGHAGVDQQDVLKAEAEFDSKKGLMIYEVEFETAAVKGEYEINASTGEILTSELKPNHSGSGIGSSGGYIGEAAAKEAALAHAGIQAEDVVEIETELDRENGVMVYEVEFQTSTQKCEYRIDAGTGEVLHYDVETRTSGKTDSNSKDDKSNSKSAETAPNDPSCIGEEAAKQAALDHAGISESSTVYLKCYYDYEHGEPVHYCVEFATESTQYEYEIDLYSGEVLEIETCPFSKHHDHT